MSLRKKVLITGITGQDGSYLAEFLIEKGYEVHGLIRRSSHFNTQRIDHLYQDRHKKDVNLFLHYSDLTDPLSLSHLLCEIDPAEVYNLGAQSHVGVSFLQPDYTANVDALGALRLLEIIKKHKIDTKFYQASSSELFGKVQEVPQKETTPFYPRKPLRSREGLRVLGDKELPGGLRLVCVKRHPVQPRVPEKRRNLRHEKDHPRT